MNTSAESQAWNTLEIFDGWPVRQEVKWVTLTNISKFNAAHTFFKRKKFINGIVKYFQKQ